MTRTWFVENQWTCKSCSTSNLGRAMNCKNCGAKKAPDVEEQMGSPDAVVTNPEMLKQAQAGANWVCEFCGGQERNLNGECTFCGGPKGLASDELKNVKYVRMKQLGNVRIQNVRADGDIIVESMGKRWKASEDELPPAAVVEDGKYDIRPPWTSLIGIKGWIAENPIKFSIFMGSIGAIAGLIWFLIWLFTPRYVDVKVSTIHWEYTSNLRSRETRHDTGWGYPSVKGFYSEATFNVSCESRYYGTEDCRPHDCRPHQVSYSCNCTSYDCGCRTSCTNNRNGYSSCSESCSKCSRCSTCYRTEYDTCYDSCPVYRDWCNYDYYEWPITKTLKTEGDDHRLYWPDLQPDGSLQRLQEIQQYQVKFVCPNDEFGYEPEDRLDFDRFNVGDFWRLQVGKIRGHNIEDLKRIKAEKE